MTRVQNIKKGCLIFTVVYIVCALFFLYIADYQIKYTSDDIYAVGTNADSNLDRLESGDTISQSFINRHEYIKSIDIFFATYEQENQGKVILELLDASSKATLAETEAELSKLQDNSWYSFTFSDMIDVSEYDERPLEINLLFELQEGDSITVGIAGAASEGELKLNGEPVEGSMCLSMTQTNNSSHAWIYPAFLLILLLLIIGYCIYMCWCESHGRMNLGLKFLNTFHKYRFLMKQLVSRDFKTKYKRSVLGVFWSFLNPLLTMSVQYVVFSRLFKFKIPHYPVYLLTGVVLFNAFNDSTTQAMNAIVGNASLITKVYVPKYIYPISKVLSSCINLLFSLIPLMIVALFTGVKPTLALLLMPFGLICLILFFIGISFFLSSAMVFFRDMQFLWGVFTMIWMYATPIIYPIDILKGSFLLPFQKINPLYHYITFFRTIVIDGISPEPLEYISCIIWALVALAVGGLLFKKTQDQFVLYI